MVCRARRRWQWHILPCNVLHIITFSISNINREYDGGAGRCYGLLFMVVLCLLYICISYVILFGHHRVVVFFFFRMRTHINKRGQENLI